MHTPSFRKDGYNSPNHFSFERHHPGTIAAWALGLLTLVIALTLLGTRLRTDRQAQVPSPAPAATPASIR